MADEATKANGDSFEGSVSDSAAVVEKGGPPDFPEGGGRAWAVAGGTGGILFCTFGLVNAFG